MSFRRFFSDAGLWRWSLVPHPATASNVVHGNVFSVGRTGRGNEGAVQREKAHPFKSEWDTAVREKERRGRRKKRN
ncbi:unnamed protein product [Arctogadus glacialis]